MHSTFLLVSVVTYPTAVTFLPVGHTSSTAVRSMKQLSCLIIFKVYRLFDHFTNDRQFSPLLRPRLCTTWSLACQSLTLFPCVISVTLLLGSGLVITINLLITVVIWHFYYSVYHSSKTITLNLILTIYNKTKITVEIFLKVNLFMWVEPIVAMFINEGNMVGVAEQREVTDDNNWYIILYLKLFSII